MAVNLTTSYQLIASKSTSTYSTLKLYGRIYETDDANLRTRIQLQARLYGNGGSGSFSSGTCVLTGDGTSQTQSLGSTSYTKSKETTLATKTFWIYHNGSGEAKNKSVSCKLTTSGTPSGTATGTINLPPLSTVSTVSIQGTYPYLSIGANNYLAITNYDNTYKNTITYSFGNSTGTVVTDYVGTELTWAIPSSLASECLYNQQIKEGTLTIATKKSDDTPIGSKTQTFTFEVYVKPRITNVQKEETDLDCKNAFGTSFSYGVVGLSKPHIEATLASYEGAYLQSAILSCGGETVDEIYFTESNITTYSYEYTFTNSITSNDIRLVVKDTRNNTYFYDLGPTSYETYTPITLTSKSVERGDIQDGEVVISYSGTSQNKALDNTTNKIYLWYKYKENNETATWSTIYDIPSGTDPQESDYNPSFSYNTTTGDWSLTNYTIDTDEFTADYTKSYVIEITFYDKCTSRGEKTVVDQRTINKAVPSMSLGENDLQINGELNLSDQDGNNTIEVFDLTGTPRYDETQSYSVGDYCVYNGSLQKCIANTTGTFDSSDWANTDIMTEISSGGGGGGGTSNYNELTNKPQINSVTLSGNKSLSDLGINIPTKTSDLTNDSGYITSSSLPTKVSDLTNDTGFITSSYHDSTKQDLITSSNKLDYSLLSNTPTIPTITLSTTTWVDGLF